MVKKATMKEIAANLGLSTATVSMVLNGKTTEISKKTVERVRDAARRMNYSKNQVARSLVTQRSDTLAIVIPDIRNMFYSVIIKSASRVAAEHGYSILLCDTDNNFDEEFEQLRILDNRLIDGILLASRNSTELLDNYANSRNLPIVILDEESPIVKDHVYTVATDNYLSGYQVAQHLLEAGHRRFFCLLGVADSTNSRRREEGVRQAFQDYGVLPQADWFAHADYKLASAYELVRHQRAVNYTALIGFNDLMTYGAMQALRERGIRVPEDVSVVGFDANTSQAMFSAISGLTLTSINQNETLIGETAAHILIRSLKGEQVTPDKQLLKAEWTMGNTVMQPQKGLVN